LKEGLLVPQIAQTPPITALTSTVQAVDQMIDSVARSMGGADDPDARVEAQKYLDRASDRINMKGVFMFRQQEHSYTTSSDPAFVDGDAYVSKPSDWGWPMDAAYAYDSGGDIIQKLLWLTWENFLIQQGNTSDTSCPQYLSMQSPLDDGIYFAPAIAAGDVTTIRVPYWARVQRISESSTISLLPETREALISGGTALYMKDRYAKAPNVWRPHMADFEDMTVGAINASTRWLSAVQHSIFPDLDGWYGSVPNRFVQPSLKQVGFE
jgi:hypothetical protein